MRFRWHEAARLYGPDGAETEPVPAEIAPEGPLLAIPEAPGPEAIATAMAAAAVGRGFCLHPAGRAPDGPGVPETLECLSSGSTGAPKRVVRLQASWLASHRVNADLFGIGPGDACAALGAGSHSLTLYAAVEALCLGADMHLLGGLRPDRQARRLAEAGVTLLNATPTQLRMLAEAGGVLPALRLVLIGGGALDAATRAAVAAMAPNARIRVYYGASETSFIALSDEDSPGGSVGRPYPGVEIAVRDASSAARPEGETGEIWVRSPYLFEGYAGGDAGDTRWDGDWLTVGEMGRLEDGQLYLSGRRSRMFAVADRNLFPEALESLILSLPGVARAAVLPQPDRARGQVPVALVQGGPGEATIRDACRATVGPELAPRRVVELADWPLLPSGKTDLQALERYL